MYSCPAMTNDSGHQIAAATTAAAITESRPPLSPDHVGVVLTQPRDNGSGIDDSTVGDRLLSSDASCQDVDMQEGRDVVSKCTSELSTSHVTATTEASSDTDDDGRCISLETASVDVYTSILNISDEDYEDDDDLTDEVDDGNVLFSDDRSDSYLDNADAVNLSFAIEDAEADDLRDESCHSGLFPPQEACELIELPQLEDELPSKSVVSAAAATDRPSLSKPLSTQAPSILDHMDHLFDRLCISETEDNVFFSAPCSHQSAFATVGCHVYHGLVPRELSRFGLVQRHQEQVQERKRLGHASRSQHHARVQRLLADRGRRSSAQSLRRVSSELVKSSNQERTRTRSRRNQPTDHGWEPCLGWSRALGTQPRIMPIEVSSVDNDVGYDSDPGMVISKTTPIERSKSPNSVVPRRDSRFDDNDDDDDDDSVNEELDVYYRKPSLQSIAQSSLNTTWSLVWMCQNKPVQVQVWIERGTLLQGNNGMVEPSLMWRRSQSVDHSRFAAPLAGTVRLLHVTRVVELISETRNSMCRAGSSWEVHTIAGDTFTFSAASPEERDAVVLQWKSTVSRLAALAVFEDASAILDEFFRDTPPIGCRT